MICPKWNNHKTHHCKALLKNCLHALFGFIRRENSLLQFCEIIVQEKFKAPFSSPRSKSDRSSTTKYTQRWMFGHEIYWIAENQNSWIINTVLVMLLTNLWCYSVSIGVTILWCCDYPLHRKHIQSWTIWKSILNSQILSNEFYQTNHAELKTFRA